MSKPHRFEQSRLLLQVDPATGNQIRTETYFCVDCGRMTRVAHRSELFTLNFPPCRPPRNAWEHLLEEDPF